MNERELLFELKNALLSTVSKETIVDGKVVITHVPLISDETERRGITARYVELLNKITPVTQ